MVKLVTCTNFFVTLAVYPNINHLIFMDVNRLVASMEFHLFTSDFHSSQAKLFKTSKIIVCLKAKFFVYFFCQ